jgi:hypothetical protein
MKSQKLLPVVVLVFGVVAALIGLALVTAYFLEAVIARLGEPDQSLLFWYLPILFLRLAGAALGIVAGTWGILSLRRISRRTRRTGS